MNSLQQFLLKQDASSIQEQIDLGGRLKGHPLTIKVLSGEQYNSFQQICLENANSRKKRRFNTKKFNELIVINCLVDPNLKDAEMIKEAGVADSNALLYKCFLAGEISTLSEKILELSGFTDDIEDDMDEVKNS